jgi:hypothetical protein
MNPGRDYGVFESLAGVRGESKNSVSPPRGYPEDASYAAQEDYWVYLGPETSEWANRDKAEGWVVRGESRWRDESKRWVSHPDYHSHSWLTLAEFRKALNACSELEQFYKPDAEYWAVIAAMEELEKRGKQTRIVFWFDN